MALFWKRQEADDILHKLLRTRTTLMTAFLANTLAQAESLLHSLERAEGGIDFHVKADKTEYMGFNISTLKKWFSELCG